ncbi:nucleoside phosphatase family-domain-containing protein [Panaeolus papilionaceus]|nr:nucleoside phosphatase family-domain-containing protein [Panaeolus papilionaceus]
MAPPTKGDPWLAGRHFGIVIDAGSSGSRLQIYSWKDPKSIRVPVGSALAYTLPKVEKGTQDNDLWVAKVEPGLSSLAEHPEDVGAYLQPLLGHALEQIPPSLHKETPIFLLATAGMRLLPPKQQAQILHETCRYFIKHSNFKIDDPSSLGPCGSNVRIITGEEEGLFGWIAVNYLMDGFSGSHQDRTTYGFLDMGGASTQIAFEPSPANQKQTKDLINVRLRLLGGHEIHHKVFVTTWLGYGTNQARERYVGQTIAEYDSSKADQVVNDSHHVVPDPCLPQGLKLVESPVHTTKPSSNHVKKPHHMVGTGSFSQCMKQTEPLLNKEKPCPDSNCLMNGVHVPPIDFSVSHFIGISEYWYSSEHIFGLGGAYDFVQYERAAEQFCSRDWQGIIKQHEESRNRHQLGGDGEVIKDGQVVAAGQWGPKVEIPRLQMQCFKAAWIANVLHEGIKLPRIVDPGGNATTNGDKVVEEAGKKGLGRPTFQSLDTVGDIAISWTLGKMVLEASKEVPPLSKGTKPLVDPIDDIEDIKHSPIQPIIPPFLSLDGIEHRISPHLPASLTRNSLGFSPVLLLFYVFFVCLVLLVVCPMRRQLRSLCLRNVRKLRNRDSPYGDLMEEGYMLNGSLPASPSTSGGRWLRSIGRIFSGPKPKLKSSLSIVTSNNPALRHIAPNGSFRAPPIRSFTAPNGTSNGTATTTQYISRSPSPSPSGFMEDISSYSSQSSLMTSRSRNTSQINLSTMTPRLPISRANSSYYVSDNKQIQ